jgi:hypothetical protein
MLYVPHPCPARFKLQILVPGVKSRQILEREQYFGNYDDPLCVMLNKFGKIIPIRSQDDMSRDGWEVAEPLELIFVRFVCFQSLQKVASIEIEWVDVLSLHLEFNSVTRRLKVFRFPSFCRLMYSGGHRSIVSRYVII